MKKDKFTIILLHYNQQKYIYNAIDSILKQNYNNIELLITDDNSKKFDQEKIINYIEKNKNTNLTNYNFVINEKNIGTVKTLNKAIKKATGNFAMFFAADDELYDENVIAKFVNAFKKSNAEIVSAQCIMYDEKIEKKLYDFVTEKNKIIINDSSPKKLFSKMAEGCLLAAGATSYKKELFNKINFDETYKLIEDWPYYLVCSRKGIKINYFDFEALKHRNGGVSHSFSYKISPTIKQYYKDVFNIYENEIIPFFNELSLKAKFKVISDYKYYKNNFSTEDHIYKKKSLTYKLFDVISILLITLNDYIYNCTNLNGLIELIYELVMCLILKSFLSDSLLLKIILILFIAPKIIAFIFYKIRKIIKQLVYIVKKIKKKLKYGNAHYDNNESFRI